MSNNLKISVVVVVIFIAALSLKLIDFGNVSQPSTASSNTGSKVTMTSEIQTKKEKASVNDTKPTRETSNSVWDKFFQYEDLYLLALELKSGLANDETGEISYMLGRIIFHCTAFKLMGEPAEATSFNRLDEFVAFQSSRCANFSNSDFKELPAIEEAYLQSAKAGYLPAEIFLFTQSTKLGEQFSEQEIDFIDRAVKSEDARALEELSELYRHKKSRLAFALNLLSCDFEYDCSAQSIENWKIQLYVMCNMNHVPFCDKENIDFSAYLEASIGRDEFVEVRSLKEKLKESGAQHGSLETFLLEYQ